MSRTVFIRYTDGRFEADYRDNRRLFTKSANSAENALRRLTKAHSIEKPFDVRLSPEALSRTGKSIA